MHPFCAETRGMVQSEECDAEVNGPKYIVLHEERKAVQYIVL